eukprot:gnl/MRDRNA2_/MRDRNA2_29670_c0_seq1.p1 gnl/MRDRNA2_/MRDRNA2_29670_c0~~gnl/MRDRNA2_/MRDRNA2_29670_c0_seq1.p1  ORF type:complete len:204 (-),score=32.54 gnl/MRDRNA2_/MRDRNA2_29670_c0_seq1:198-809(-)
MVTSYVQLEDNDMDQSRWQERQLYTAGCCLLSVGMVSALFMSSVLPSQANVLLTKDQVGLTGEPLKSCTTSSDSGPTGFTRAGSCKFESFDSGYHEVCVTMTKDFLKQSALHDGNDLSSVVAPGGHWCICAWAWASAVARDPSNAEGLKLDCGATNGHLREVYKANLALPGPTGTAYETKAALKKVDNLCDHDKDLQQNFTKP